MAHRSDWQKVDPDLRSHPAFAHLTRLLNLRSVETHGLLAGLWAMAYRQAEDGDLSRFKPAALAALIDYDSDPDELLVALVEAGFLERVDGRLMIHGWYDWGGAAFRERDDGAKRTRKYRKNKQVEPDVTVTSPSHTCDTALPSYSYSNSPSSVSSSQAQPDISQAQPETNEELVELEGEIVRDELFDVFWSAWPHRHGSKKTARARFNRSRRADQESILLAEAHLIQALNEGLYEEQYLMLAENFVGGQKSYYDQWIDGIPAKYRRGNGNGSKKQREIEESIARAINSVEWPEEES